MGWAGKILRVDLDAGACASPDDVLAMLDLPGGETSMILINGASVAPGERAALRLEEGDKLTVFPPIKGG